LSVAFFDLDRTVLCANSGSLWVRRELALGHISRWQALQASAWLARYHLGLAAMEDAVTRAITHLKGLPEAALRLRSETFYETEVRLLVRPGAREAIAAHRAKGHRLALLTSSMSYLAERVQQELAFDASLSNRFEVDAAGLYTGRTVGAVCFGAGKLSHAQAYARAQGVELSACTFYTDSYSDLPVLTAVGTPVAVNPDRRLAREARRRGWPILDWGVP
jgi:HAD superfamily hydrolase (TIGR01490 family)